MTYCVGILTREGIVLGSDSRTNAGYDDVTTCRKMHRFEVPGERAFVILCSGSLSLSQSVLTLLDRDFRQGRGLGSSPTMYDAAREVGNQIRHVSTIDRADLERDKFRYNIHMILGGQIKGEGHRLYLIYPQGNPLSAAEESPYLQIGEAKYGRPILDRGIRYDTTSLEEAAKYAMISMDSTMRSNVTVGPPIDLAVYTAGELRVSRHRRFGANDPDLAAIRDQWERTLRKGVQELPAVKFGDATGSSLLTPQPAGERKA